MGTSKAFNPLDLPQRKDFDDTARRIQARVDAPLGPIKLSSTLAVPVDDLTRTRQTVALGSEHTKVKWTETRQEEQTLGVEHSIDHSNASIAKHTFVEGGVHARNSPNGPTNGVYLKLRWSF
jgi:hypothetical protein